MKKTENTTKNKHSILAGIVAILVLLFGGYFGNSIIDHPEEQGYQKNQEIENNTTDHDIADNNIDAITYQFRSEKLWQQHYEKHGIEMGFDNKEDYLFAANKVIENKDVLHKLEEEDGDDVYYLEETNEFVIVSTDGYLRTYFNPNDGINYFNRQ